MRQAPESRSASSTASTTSTVAAQQVEQVVTGDASNFTYAGLINLQNALKEDYQANAVFLFRRASNANVMQITRGGLATGIVAIPNRYMHSPVEVVSLGDLENSAKLIAEFCLAVNPDSDFTP